MEQNSTPRIRLITRADDAGSNSSANWGILEATDAGFLKNVSVLVPGPAIEEAALFFTDLPDLCFGLHTCLNAEWESVRWGSVAPASKVSSLLDSTGHFFNTTQALHQNQPRMEEIFLELDAQLERGKSLGFHFTYADAHMGWEWVLPGLKEQFDVWCTERGLLNYAPRSQWLQGFVLEEDPIPPLIACLERTPPGQYTLVGHPAYDNEEMRGLGHKGYPGERVAWERERERQLFMDTRLFQYCYTQGIRPIRYDEATLLKSIEPS